MAWCFTLALVAGALVWFGSTSRSQPDRPIMTPEEAAERLARIHVGMSPTDVIQAIFPPEQSKAILRDGPIPNPASVTGPFAMYVEGWIFTVTYSAGKVVSRKMSLPPAPTRLDKILQVFGF
jgi:hypothetical protein